jgi:hypothetical protein
VANMIKGKQPEEIRYDVFSVSMVFCCIPDDFPRLPPGNSSTSSTTLLLKKKPSTFLRPPLLRPCEHLADPV